MSYTKEDKTVSSEEAAENALLLGIEVEDWAKKYGYTNSDFQKGAAGTSALATPENNQAPLGTVLDLEDGSSDLPENNSNINLGVEMEDFQPIADFDFEDPYAEPLSKRRFIQFKDGGRVFEDTYLKSVEDNPRDKYNRLKPDTFEGYVKAFGFDAKNIGTEGIKEPKVEPNKNLVAARSVLTSIKDNFVNEEIQLLETEDYAAKTFVPQNERPTKWMKVDKFDKGRERVIENEDYDTFVTQAQAQLGGKGKEKNVLDLAKALYIKHRRNVSYSKNIEDYARDNESSFVETSVGSTMDYINKVTKTVATADQKLLKDRLVKLELFKESSELMQKQRIKIRSITYGSEIERLAAAKEDKYLYENIVAANANYKEYYENSIEDLVKKNAENSAILDVTKRSYKLTAIASLNVAATIGETIGGVLSVPEWLVTSTESIITGVSPDKTVSAMSGVFDFGGDALLEAGKDLRGYAALPLEVGDINSISDFAYWGTDMVSNQALNTALMVAMPAASLGIMAASAAGGKYSDMMGGIKNGTAEYSGWQMFGAPAIVGGLEYATERISLGQLKGITSVFKKGNKISKEANKYIADRILNKNYFIDTFSEGAAEGINQLGGNVTDMFLLQDKKVHIWDGVSNAIASGAFMSGVVYKAPVVGAKLLDPFTKEDMRPRILANVQMLNKIELELAKPGLSDVVIKNLKDSSTKIQEANTNVLAEQFDGIDRLDDGQKTNLIDIDKQKAAIQAEADAISKDKTASDDIKASLLKTKQIEFDNLNNEKQNILAKANADSDIVKLTSLLDQFNDKSEAVVFETDDKGTASDKIKAFLIKQGRTEKQAEAEKDNYGAFITDKNDSTKEYLVINKDSALDDKVVTTGQHEFLHKVLKQAFAKNPDMAKTMGSLLLAEIKENPNLQSPELKLRLQQYEAKLLNPEDNFNENDFYEEVLTTFSEAVTNKEVVINETFLTKLADVIRRAGNALGYNKIKFNSSKDVLNFIKDYNRDFDKAKLSRSLNTFAEGNESVTSNKSSIKKSAKGTVLETINALIPDTVKTKADFQNRKVFNKVYQATLPNGVISNYIKSRSESKEVAEKTMESIQDRLINYDPEAVRKKANGQPITFGEFIFANTNFGKLDAKKSLAIEQREAKEKTSIDSPEAKQVADNSSSSTETIQRPKYKNLLESKLLSSDVLRSIMDKVLKTVRTLKSRMDAKVSLNKTITPLIAEIKKEMGKQADIDLKKAMGSKKGGELESFLLKNKKAILENMTTTWLMGAMPGAIQKQVDGKFTSDWQGKKIDRETVNTNNAGKTSGAEIVRRLPNVAQNISDEVFLGYILDAKGNPIRGRKESLAKALAEEVSFDIFTQQLQSEDSELSKAFEANQQRLGSERLDNLVANITKQAERGNVKFSIKIRTPKQVQAMGAAVRYLQKEGGFDFADMTAPEITNISEADLFLIKIAFDGDLVDTAKVDGFMKRFQSDPNISQEVKDQMKKATLVDKDLVAKDAAWLVANLPKDISDALGNVDIFGFHYSMLDVASSKVDKLLSALEGKQVKIPGATGKYYSDLQAAKAKQSSVNVSGIDPDILKNVALMNSSSGLMGKIGKILKSDLTADEKKALYVEKYLEQVNNANVANKIVGEYLAKYIVNAARDGKISQVTAAAILQAQTSIKDGFRGLTGLSYITFKDGEQGGLKGEHLADNASSMYKILELVFGEKSQQEINYKISAIFEFHDQWLENRQTLDEIDVYGKNNSYKSLRILLLGDARVNDVFTNDLQPARPALEVLEQTIRTAVEIGKKANFPPVLKEGTTYKPSIKLNKDFNDMLERSKGVTSEAEFSRIVAKRRGASKGKFKVWMPSSLNDFKGLTSYTFAGKGRQGDADQKFFKENLIDPYFKGIAEIELSRQTMKDDFVALNKMFKPVVKDLGTLIESGDYTNDQAIRVYLWTKAGFEIPGLSKRDQKKLLAHINNNPDLQAYADGALLVSKQPAWIKPGAFWDTQTILSDLGNMTEKVGRKNYISEFIENVDVIFSETNLNKVEALYGTRHRDALEDIIYRMKNGTNRPAGASKNQNVFNNWVNNSIGAIMFFNRRSALLQTLSTVNFLNWSDNNPAKAALAFANQPQYWKDFATIFNSAKLKQRRSGLKSDINEAEIASAVKGSKNKATAALSWLLKKGFLPTQMADSFAIAAGGATFYRNRIKTLMSQGMSKADAEAKAFSDFSEISEETQQSGDPALISSDQASVVGRLLLAFQNTPIQLNRSIKKSAQDIYNRRRMPGQSQMQSDFSNMSKIVYYGAIQNIIFTALSNALFALLPGFDDEEPTEEDAQKLKEKKLARMANGIVDTTLKGGFGLPGAVLATIKNVIMEYNKQDEKGFTADHTYTILQAANLAPPIGSKLGKVYSGIQGSRFNKEVIQNRGFGVSLDGKVNLSPKFSVWGKYIEGTTNLPLGRAVDEINAIVEAFDTRNTTMQRIALGLGWRSWDVGTENEENDIIKVEQKAINKAKKAEDKKQKLLNRTPAEIAKDKKEKDAKKAIAKEKRRIRYQEKKEAREKEARRRQTLLLSGKRYINPNESLKEKEERRRDSLLLRGERYIKK